MRLEPAYKFQNKLELAALPIKVTHRTPFKLL